MSGKVFIVTGANSGIGFEVTKILCEAGHDVILACRSEEKTAKAIEKIKKKFPNALATYMNLDLASLESVRKFVDDFHATGKKLHVLVNNAGLSLNFKEAKRQYTKDNFEITMGTNHLGHFLLTHLLQGDLKASATEESPSRIVVVASSFHDSEQSKKWMKNVQPMDLDDLFLYKENAFTGLQAYKNSKTANIMFTYKMSKTLESSNVTINAICPGFVPTTDFNRNSSKASKFICRYLLRFVKMAKSVHQAAASIVTLATDEKYKGVSGKYIKDDQETKSSEESLDETKQQKLWDLSGGYCKLEGFEALEPPPIPVETKPVEEKNDKGEKEEGDKVAASEGVLPTLNGVKQAVEETKNEVKDAAGDAAEVVKSEVTERIENAKKTVSDIKTDVTEKIETQVTEVTKKGSEVIENIEDSIKDTTKNVIDGITDNKAQETPIAAEG